MTSYASFSPGAVSNFAAKLLLCDSYPLCSSNFEIWDDSVSKSAWILGVFDSIN